MTVKKCVKLGSFLYLLICAVFLSLYFTGVIGEHETAGAETEVNVTPTPSTVVVELDKSTDAAIKNDIPDKEDVIDVSDDTDVSSEGDAAGDEADGTAADTDVPDASDSGEDVSPDGSSDDSADDTTPVETRQYVFTLKNVRTNLNVRSGPGTEYDVLTKLYPGDTGIVLEIGQEFTKIEFNGITGYVTNKYISITME